MFKKLRDFRTIHSRMNEVDLMTRTTLDDQYNLLRTKLSKMVRNLTSGLEEEKTLTVVERQQQTLLHRLKADKTGLAAFYKLTDLMIPTTHIVRHKSTPHTSLTNEQAYDRLMMMEGTEYLYHPDDYIFAAIPDDVGYGKEVMEVFWTLYREHIRIHNGNDIIKFTRKIYRHFLAYYNDQVDVDWDNTVEMELFYLGLMTLASKYGILSEHELGSIHERGQAEVERIQQASIMEYQRIFNDFQPMGLTNPKTG